MPISPPKLLTGITLLFWGGMTEHAIIGLIAAILVEGKSWITTRWELSDASYVRAWHFSILGGAIIATLTWLNGLHPAKMHTLFVWAPITLLPIELAQRYGTKQQIALNTFSFFARKKQQHDEALGRTTSYRKINTGYLYIAVIILATAMGSLNAFHHFIGLSIISAICLLSSMQKNSIRPLAWITTLVIVLTLAATGQWAARALIDHYTGATSGQLTSTTESRTSIGKLGELKLSSKIYWRMKVNEGNVPDLLSTAIYNTYSGAVWRHRKSGDEARDSHDYIGPEDIELTENSTIHIFEKNSSSYLEKNKPIQIIGELNASIKENPIPLPHKPTAILTAGKQTGVESNSLGTVRINNPDYPVIDYAVWQSGSSTTEEAPNNKYDLTVPDAELKSIQRVNQALGLDQNNLRTIKKVQIIQQFFQKEFTYTTHLTTPPLQPVTRQSAVSNFLENTKAGHCEYFATATALMLRESGIPARYCVGFAVKDRTSSNDQWLIRGTAAHAWCRVWIDGQWEDIDLTPPSWSSIEGHGYSGWQRKIIDWWQLAREDFLLWRTSATNKSIVFNSLGFIVLLLAIWIIWKLWKSRKKHAHITRYKALQPSEPTSLNKLEPLITKKIGARPQGTTLRQWISPLHEQDPSISPLLEQAIQLHTIIRFDPSGNSQASKDQLTELTKKLRLHIKTIPPMKH